MIVTQYGVGVYAPSVQEAHFTLKPFRSWGAARGVLWCHGALAEFLPQGFDGAAVTGGIPRAIAATAPVLAGELGGLLAFGNDAALARLTDARTHLLALGATGPVVVVGVSMGGATACNWARAHPELVRALALIIPALDVEDIRARGADGGEPTGILGPASAAIEASFGGLAGWQAARPTHNPVQYAGDLAGIPTRVWFSADDPVATPASVATFAAATDCDTQSMGAISHWISDDTPAQVAAWVQGLA